MYREKFMRDDVTRVASLRRFWMPVLLLLACAGVVPAVFYTRAAMSPTSGTSPAKTRPGSHNEKRAGSTPRAARNSFASFAPPPPRR